MRRNAGLNDGFDLNQNLTYAHVYRPMHIGLGLRHEGPSNIAHLHACITPDNNLLFLAIHAMLG